MVWTADTKFNRNLLYSLGNTNGRKDFPTERIEPHSRQEKL
jgi:hypothetical protein